MAISTTFQGLVPRPGGIVKKPPVINQGLIQRPDSQGPAVTTISNQGLVQRPGSQGPDITSPVNQGTVARPGGVTTTTSGTGSATSNTPVSSANTPTVPNVTQAAPTNQQDCLKAGGRWVDGVCQLYEKAPEYVAPATGPKKWNPLSA